jgi:hypothetical protein
MSKVCLKPEMRMAREVHRNGCEGASAALRTHLRSFCSYVSTFEAITCVALNLGDLQPPFLECAADITSNRLP